jgi:hypothetical protein
LAAAERAKSALSRASEVSVGTRRVRVAWLAYPQQPGDTPQAAPLTAHAGDRTERDKR